MSADRHPYRLGVRGRSLSIRPGVGGKANLQCSACGHRGQVGLRAVMPGDQIDQKFQQLGWSIDPAVCPSCRSKKKEAAMAKPTAAAMKAQTQMFHLLSAHFDAEAGRFAEGWSDRRIGEETGLAADVVTEYRRAGFGEIKEPAEVRQLRTDINDFERQARAAVATIEQLAKETLGGLDEQIAGMRERLALLTAGMVA